MDRQRQRLEFDSISKEYESFFAKCQVQKNAKRPSDYYSIADFAENYLHIQTHAGKEFDVTVSIRGWSVLAQNQCYESFEALMMDVSPEFQSRFGSELTSKLEMLLGP